MALPAKYGVGFDPAWVTLGSAIIKESSQPFKVDILWVKTSSPGKEEGGPCFHIDGLFHDMNQILNLKWPGECLIPTTMERFVSYGNVRSSHTEEITRVIGIIEMACYYHHGLALPVQHKAIDWKTKLCQNLVKYAGFDNPSASLDKKFSLAAARHISTNPEKITNDHEADAICLAAYPHILAQVQAARTSGRTPLDGLST